MAVKGTNISRENLATLDAYVKSVSKGRSHIEKEYEVELIGQYRNGTASEKKKALDILVSYNITIFADICISVLNTIRGGDRIDPLDLMQIAVISYMKKLDTWDETKKSKMITYYYREVRTQMQRFVMAHAFPLKQGSVFLQHLAYTLSKIRARWLADKKREPSIRTLSKETGVSESTIKSCIRATGVQVVSVSETPTIVRSEFYPDSYNPIIDVVNYIINRAQLTTEEADQVYYYLESREVLNEELIDKMR